MFAGHHHFVMLVKSLNNFSNQAVTWLFVIFFVLYSYRNFYRIANKNGLHETKPLIAIRHCSLIHHVCGKTDRYSKYQGAMCHSLFEWLGLAPFSIHVMREKITRLPGMNYDI